DPINAVVSGAPVAGLKPQVTHVVGAIRHVPEMTEITGLYATHGLVAPGGKAVLVQVIFGPDVHDPQLRRSL
ncbi:MAG: hypothetical protein J2P17_34530, partial [Mycobacterium sp.]|nr:hypothetical protein [Mycobacterium sp.]